MFLPYFLKDCSACNFNAVPCADIWQASFVFLVLESQGHIKLVLSWKKLALWYVCSNSDAAAECSFFTGMLLEVCHFRGE